MRIAPINFTGKPNNYKVVDKNLSRSAQPKQEDFLWLKKQGVTDVFNFCTEYETDIGFSEEETVKNLGMHYHKLPSIPNYPSMRNVDIFLSEVDDIAKDGGKVHIHCHGGADRTGMYSYIYKSIKGIGNSAENQQEMLDMGHDSKAFPNIIPWASIYLEEYDD